MTAKDYKKQLNDCRIKIQNQRAEIKRLEAINATLSAGNIFGAFIELVSEFSNRFHIVHLYFSNKCPCCNKALQVKSVYEYNKETSMCRFISLELQELRRREKQ